MCALLCFCVTCMHVCSWRVLDLLVLKADYGQPLEQPVVFTFGGQSGGCSRFFGSGLLVVGGCSKCY